MPYDATYPSPPPVQRSFWKVFAWACVFFVLINIAVWCVFDRSYFDRVGFERMLNEASDNEVQSLIHHIRSDEGFRHVILLGDSTIWGAPLPYNQTIARHIADAFVNQPDTRVINLSVPGASFADQYAILEQAYAPDDTYVFFINPIWFQEKYSAMPYGELIRFPQTVAESVFDDRETLADCCNLIVPSPSDPAPAVRRFISRVLPLYRNRDAINAVLFGMHPTLAERAVLSRLGKQERPAESIENTENPNGKGALPAPDITNARMTSLLRYVRGRIGDRTNVYFVLLDDDQFFRSPQHTRNIRLILDILGTERVLNLQDTIDHELFSGTTHLLPEAQERVAEAILRQLNVP